MKSLVTTSSDDVPSAISSMLEGLLDDFQLTIQSLAGGSTVSRPTQTKKELR